MLSRDAFQNVIRSTPLVSIDLVVRDPQGYVLLGKRVNRPAQGYWFVPGGRIEKNESVQDAFMRLLRGELGISSGKVKTSFLGVFKSNSDVFHI